MGGSFWKTWMLAGILSASGSPHLPHNPLTYDKALRLGVEIYNKKAGEDFLYRLLKDVPQTEWDPYSESSQELNFTIQQTVCPVEEFSMDECDFKENGLVRQCTGYYFLEERPPVAVLICDTVEGSAKEEEKEEEKKDQPKRVKRFKDFFRKIWDGIRDFFRKNRFVVGVNFRI